jgi:hypothetical protein
MPPIRAEVEGPMDTMVCAAADFVNSKCDNKYQTVLFDIAGACAFDDYTYTVPFVVECAVCSFPRYTCLCCGRLGCYLFKAHTFFLG